MSITRYPVVMFCCCLYQCRNNIIDTMFLRPGLRFPVGRGYLWNLTSQGPSFMITRRATQGPCFIKEKRRVPILSLSRLKYSFGTDVLVYITHHQCNPPACTLCGYREETVNHFLFDCPNLQSTRNEFLPQNPDLENTLFSDREQLLKTSRYFQKAIQQRAQAQDWLDRRKEKKTINNAEQNA